MKKVNNLLYTILSLIIITLGIIGLLDSTLCLIFLGGLLTMKIVFEFIGSINEDKKFNDFIPEYKLENGRIPIEEFLLVIFGHVYLCESISNGFVVRNISLDRYSTFEEFFKSNQKISEEIFTDKYRNDYGTLYNFFIENLITDVDNGFFKAYFIYENYKLIKK